MGKRGVPTSMVLPDEVWELIKIKAARERKSLKAVVVEAVEHVLADDDRAVDEKAAKRRAPTRSMDGDVEEMK